MVTAFFLFTYFLFPEKTKIQSQLVGKNSLYRNCSLKPENSVNIGKNLNRKSVLILSTKKEQNWQEESRGRKLLCLYLWGSRSLQYNFSIEYKTVN